MDQTLLVSLILAALVFLYLGIGMWLFTGLIMVSITALYVLLDFPVDRIGLVTKSMLWRGSTIFEVATVPMFVWMGEIIYRTDISTRLFRGLGPLVRRLPGQLLHTSVLGCTLFAAVSGSSTATVATVGRITAQELITRGYEKQSVLGSLCAAGSIGILIPPSIVMIVYGVLAEVSIARLFAAGFLPGLLLSGLFISYLMLRSLMRPASVPAPADNDEKTDWARVVLDLAPIVLLIACVLGSIYAGIATPAESAAIGVVLALAIALVSRQLSWRLLGDSLMGAVRTSCMICSLVATAALLSTTMGYLHIPLNIASTIADMELTPFQLLLLLAVFYTVLGMFLDGISITVMTLPISLPLVQAAGYDPIWFGVFLIVLIEMAQITPPIGFNLFVLQSISAESIWYIARASLPFFLLMIVSLVILTVIPNIVMVLPNLLF